MDLPNRSKLEVEMRRAVGRVFREYGDPRPRMPAWGDFKADLIEQILPVIHKIQVAAIRNMFAKYGDGPAPPEAKAEALERATELAEDLVTTSTKRWKDIPRRKTEQAIADWYAVNFGKRRATVIGVTETSLAHTKGEEIAWRWLKKQGIELETYWVAEPDACDRCLPMHMKPRKYWKRYYPAGPGSPHPACRCHAIHEQVTTQATQPRRRAKSAVGVFARRK